MDIITWNVNGLRSAEKKGFIEWVDSTQYDLYCLQEIRGNKEQFSTEIKNIEGYDVFFNSAEKKGYSGTGIYSRQKPQNVVTKIGHKRFDKEGRFIRLDFHDFSLINLYIPNGGKKKEWFEYKFEAYEHLFDYLKKESSKNLIITGDFNIAHKEIDLAHPQRNKNSTMFTPKERKMIDELLSLGFVDTFREFVDEGGNYTWWSNFGNAREKNLGWRIDYVFVSKNLKNNLKDAYILRNVKGSDHCPAGISIDLT